MKGFDSSSPVAPDAITVRIWHFPLFDPGAVSSLAKEVTPCLRTDAARAAGSP
jgi:hypothetical protein